MFDVGPLIQKIAPCVLICQQKKRHFSINECDWKIICIMLFYNVMNNSIVFQMCHMTFNLLKSK
jgi:hypothetical protein